MDTIVLRVSDLVALADELKADKMDFVQLQLEPADTTDPDDVLPACAYASATKLSVPRQVVDYDELEEAEEGLTTFKAGSVHTNITR